MSWFRCMRVRVRVKGLVGPWIYPLADEFLAEMGIPVVLDLIICASRNPPSYQRPPEISQRSEKIKK